MNAQLKGIWILIGFCSSLVAAEPTYRDYNKPLTVSDARNIHYIITTLSNSSIMEIMLNRGSIERAGDYINPVHPLQFFLCIFTNKELTICMHNIKKRSLIWKDFFNGLATSLQKESSEKSFDKYVADFAKKLKIKPSPLEAAAREKKWDNFLEVLFAEVVVNVDKNR